MSVGNKEKKQFYITTQYKVNQETKSKKVQNKDKIRTGGG